MKKLSILLGLFIMLMSIGYGAFGQSFIISSNGLIQSADDFVYTYVSSSRTINITGYIGSSNTIMIPTKLINYPVTKVDKYAFDNKGLTNVTFQDGIKNIIFNAFSNNSLTSLVIPNTVTAIGSLAFDNNNLAIISFKGDTIPTFGQNVFYRNSLLRNICISDTTSLTAWRTALTNAGVPASVNIIQGRNGVCTDIGTGAIGEDEKLVCGTNAYQSGDICICLDEYEGDPYSLCSISLDLTCFNFSYSNTDEHNILTGYNCTNKEIVIPDKASNIIVGEIGTSAFDNLQITSIEIGSNVKKIGTYAFRNNSLKTVTIPSSVTSISQNAFTNSSLKSLIFKGNTPPIISSNAFSSNAALYKICVPSGKTSLYQTALASAGLPTSVTYYEDESKCNIIDHSFTAGDISYTCTKSTHSGSHNTTNYTFACRVTNTSTFDLANWIIDLNVPVGATLTNFWGARASILNNIITIRNNTNDTLTPNSSTNFTIVVNSSTNVEFNSSTSSGGAPVEEIETEDSITDGLSATINVTGHWSNIYACSVTITNNSGVNLLNWILDLQVPTGTTMYATWNADSVVDGNTITLTPKWNNTINNTKSISFNFQLQYTGTSFAPTVKSIRGSIS